jgi:hypothetical protein
VRDRSTSRFGNGRNKYVDVNTKTPSIVQFFFPTNSITPVKIEQGDRRIVAQQCLETKPSKEYLDTVYALESNMQALVGVFKHLMKRKITNKNWIDDRPITEYYRYLQEADWSACS